MTWLTLHLILAHSFYSDACCSGNHCHPVPCESVVSEQSGWRWNGMHFHYGMLHNAPDGNCHVCVAAGPICIYLPTRS